MKRNKKLFCFVLWSACLFFVLPACTRGDFDGDETFVDIAFTTAKMSFGLEGGVQINEIIGDDANYELWAIYDYQNDSYANLDSCALKVRIEGRQVMVSLPPSEGMTRWMVFIGALTYAGSFVVWQE